jgi:hypothetical protein
MSIPSLFGLTTYTTSRDITVSWSAAEWKSAIWTLPLASAAGSIGELKVALAREPYDAVTSIPANASRLSAARHPDELRVARPK